MKFSSHDLKTIKRSAGNEMAKIELKGKINSMYYRDLAALYAKVNRGLGQAEPERRP